MDAHIAVLHTKVDALLEKQKELTARVRANEKVVAAVTLLGTVALAVIGAGYFAPKAEACSPPADGSEFTCPPWDDVLVKKFEDTVTDESFDEEFPDYFSNKVTVYDTRMAHMGHSFPTGEWIQKMRDHESRKTRTQPEDSIGNALDELNWNEEE